MWRVYNLHHASVFTYSHANTPLGQSERTYYLSYFINARVKSTEILFELWLIHDEGRSININQIHNLKRNNNIAIC